MAFVSEPQGPGMAADLSSGPLPGPASALVGRDGSPVSTASSARTQLKIEVKERPAGQGAGQEAEQGAEREADQPTEQPGGMLHEPTETHLHTHRQNHNCSKLPTFRFADLKKDALVLPCRLQNVPPSPISPRSPRPAEPCSDAAQDFFQGQQQHPPANPPATPPSTDANFTVSTACPSAGDVHETTTAAAAAITNNTAAATTNTTATATATAANTTAAKATAHTPTASPTASRAFQNPQPPPQSQQQQQQQQASSSSSSSPSTAVTASSVNTSSFSSASHPVTSPDVSPPRRPASFPNSPPKVIVSAANTTSSSFSSLSLLSPLSSSASATLDPPGPTKLQRTLTDPIARRAPASFSSHGLETARGPPTAFTAKRVQAVNVQAAAAAAAVTVVSDATEWANLGSEEPSQPSQPSAQPSASSSAPSDQHPDHSDQQQLQSQPADEKKKPTSRPPISFRPPRAIIPPIRSFRSSGSRKSLGLEPMSHRSPGDSDDLDVFDNGVHDPNQRDRTLRALEGRSDDLTAHSIQSMATVGASDSENTADLFMRIAREDTRKRTVEDRPENHAMRVTHSASNSASQRRPFSAAVPSHRPASPPQVARRHSDQRETARIRRSGDDSQPTYSRMSTREATQRGLASDRPSPIRTSIAHKPEPIRTSRTVVSATRPSPSTPRTSVFFDTASEVGTNYTRRRPSADNGNSNIMPARASSIKPPHAHAYTRTYNSSPLATRPEPPQRRDSHDAGHGANNSNGNGGPLEGTESSTSTAAPSTVWDELDDLKSRMRRLELSGKIPPTSGAAMSRVSDDRPRTATTSATTVSGSPKRGANNTQADARSTTSSQLRQQQNSQQQSQQDQQSSQSQQLLSLQQSPQPPLQSNLLTALQKAKAQISEEVYITMETVATEALALSQMVGVAGQPGPISSGASSIGGTGQATVTDRQLRRKADSICRSLTELCLALNEEATHKKAAAAAAAAVASVTSHVQATAREARESRDSRESREEVAPPAQATTPAPAAPPSIMASPMVSKTFTFTPSYTPQSLRRSTTENVSPSVPTSPRGSMPRLTEERERRTSTFLMTPTMSSASRHLGPPVSADNIGRRSSLMISRSRRAVSEEPEDMMLAGRRSSLLRTRRAGTEEPEDATAHGSGRKSSLLLRSRRAMAQAASDDDEETTTTTMVTRVMRSPMMTSTTTTNTTEAGALRSAAARERAYHAQAQAQAQAMALAQAQAQAQAQTVRIETPAGEMSPLGSSALPRRRLIPTSLKARLVSPQMTAAQTQAQPQTPTFAGRRFLERTSAGMGDREHHHHSAVEERTQRQLSLTRTGSTTVRRMTRDTPLHSMSSAASQVGGYR